MLVIQPELNTALRVQLAARVRDMATAADVEGVEPEAIARGVTPVIVEPADRLAEAAQHLRNLGYVEHRQARHAVADRGASLRTGYRAFALEARRWLAGEPRERFDPALVKALDGIVAEAADHDRPLRLDALVVELLRTLTSLDGEFAIGASPALGDSGLPVRVAQFRLNAFGLYNQAVDGRFGTESERAMTRGLNVLGSLWPILAERPPGSLLDWLGDVPFLLRSCGHRGKLANMPVVVRTMLNTFADAGRRSPVGDGASALREQDNDFALCLVQNALWATGFYDGRLDGIWNEKSVVALKLAVHGVPLGATGPVSTIAEDQFAIWLPDLADTLLDDVDFLGDLSTTRDADRQRVVAQGVERRLAAAPAARRGLFGWIKGLFEQAVALGRSIMVGVRSLMRAALDAVRRGIDFLADVADFLIGKVKGLALLIYRSAREAVLALAGAIAPIRHFLFGVPIVSVGPDGVVYAATKVRIDRDVEQWVAASAEVAEIKAHAALYQHLSRTFAGTVRVAILFAKLVIVGISGPLGWAAAALSFARVVSDMVPR